MKGIEFGFVKQVILEHKMTQIIWIYQIVFNKFNIC